jgi:hypothetical protein
MTPELKAALDDLQAALPNEFAQVVHVGVTNCRHKNNDDDQPWSEHAWSNAADLMLTTGAPATGSAKLAGDRLAAYMRSRPDLWSEVFWQIAAHYNHPHGTAAPRKNFDNEQIPPCAGEEDNDMAILTDAEQKELQEFLANLKAINSNVDFVTFLIPWYRLWRSYKPEQFISNDATVNIKEV